MENTIKIERLNAAAERAEKTINRAQNWEANRNNAAARLFAINAATTIIDYLNNVVEHAESEKTDFDAAADYLHGLFMATFNAQIKARAAFEASFSAIKAAATPAVLAAAVNSRGFQFDAAIRGCYQSIKAAADLSRAEKWEKVTSERAERAAADGAKKSKNAAKRAARAAERAAALRAKIG
jgi:hypothetical protein